jgi:hypothetical protein
MRISKKTVYPDTFIENIAFPIKGRIKFGKLKSHEIVTVMKANLLLRASEMGTLLGSSIC